MPKYYMPTTLLSGNSCIKRHPHHTIRGKYTLIVIGRHSAVELFICIFMLHFDIFM